MNVNFLTKTVIITILLSLTGCVSNTTSFTSPTPQQLQNIQSIDILIQGSPKFIHIGEMASESTAGMLLGGLGVMIDAASRSGKDADSAHALEPEKVVAKAHDTLSKSLTKNLSANNQFGNIKAISPEAAMQNNNALLTIDIVQWGSRQKSKSSNTILPFIKTKITLKDKANNKTIWKDNQIITNDKKHTLEEYKKDPQLFENDFDELINKTGKQIATILIKYRNPS